MMPLFAFTFAAMISTAAFASPPETQPAPPPDCATLAAAREFFSSLEQKAGATFVDIQGADAEKLMLAWNNQPPVSHDEAQEILIAAVPAGATFVYVFVNHGQACDVRSLPIARLTSWLRDAFAPTPTSHHDDGRVTPWSPVI
jgi:hypothetical protein